MIGLWGILDLIGCHLDLLLSAAWLAQWPACTFYTLPEGRTLYVLIIAPGQIGYKTATTDAAIARLRPVGR